MMANKFLKVPKEVLKSHEDLIEFYLNNHLPFASVSTSNLATKPDGQTLFIDCKITDATRKRDKPKEASSE